MRILIDIATYLQLDGRMKKQGRVFQCSLFDMKTKNAFGGALLKKSHAKEKRPVSTKNPMHIVVRSGRARGSRSFLSHYHRPAIDRIVRVQSKKWGVKIYRYENVGNHLHILLKTSHRICLIRFLRAITGLIARRIMGAERGQAKGMSFWDARPFSRIVSWGREYRAIHRYFDKNQIQATGFSLDHKPGALNSG